MKELKPYLKAATKWTTANEDRHDVVHTLKCLKVFLDTKGEPVRWDRVRGLRPKQKARSVLASFRDAKDERELFIIALALEAIVQHVGPRGPEWIGVQIAKRIHRVNATRNAIADGEIRANPKWMKPEGRKMVIAGTWVREEARVFELEGAVEEVIDATNTG